MTVIPANIKKVFDGPGGTRVGLVTINAKTAQSWLRNYNKLNRTLSGPRVVALAEEMTNGEWEFIGDAIRFSKVLPAGTELPNGNVLEVDQEILLDGQHRLQAIVDSGKSQVVLVISGLEVETQNIIDTGRKRSVADMLKLNGYENHRALAGALVSLSSHLHYRAGGFYGQFGELSHLEALELVEKYPEIVESVEYARKATRKDRYNDGCVASSLAVAHWEITNSGTMSGKVAEFFDNLITGYEPYPTSAISAVRNSWADRVRGGQTGSVNRNTRIDQIGLVLHGWHVFGPAKGKKNISAKTLQKQVAKREFPLP